MSKSAASAQKIIRSAESNMQSEGFTVTRKAKRDCIKIVKGNASAKTIVGRYVSKHSAKETR